MSCDSPLLRSRCSWCPVAQPTVTGTRIEAAREMSAECRDTPSQRRLTNRRWHMFKMRFRLNYCQIFQCHDEYETQCATTYVNKCSTVTEVSKPRLLIGQNSCAGLSLVHFLVFWLAVLCSGDHQVWAGVRHILCWELRHCDWGKSCPGLWLVTCPPHSWSDWSIYSRWSRSVTQPASTGETWSLRPPMVTAMVTTLPPSTIVSRCWGQF